MKRFYKKAAVRPAEGQFEILLDDRPVKTPARNALRVPTEGLGRAISEEWNAQGEEIDPRSMALTGLANAAIDRIAPNPDRFAAGLARYGESDLLCYRADGPDSLVELQSERWDPILAWGRRRFDIDFEVVCGIIHRPQNASTLRQLTHTVAARGPFELAALSPLVTIGGSLVIALALAEDAIDLDAAWAAATLDEAWQAEHWGEDPEAAAAFEARRREFAAGYRFLTLL
ncbi:ATP12 family chaperone protein [Allosphingosinicella sp.]|uniref:ATP12 family chaperone protein n=1 Tax=Allosphingosinicella sp. TaxID=2823234 RepID=UPI002FC10B39